MKKITHFNVGDRVYDTIRQKIGVVFIVEANAVQVAFVENIRNRMSRLSYQDAYEPHELERLQFIDNAGKTEEE
jgi:hypothetical protein